MKVSIITPTYNSAAQLPDTLDSIISQGYRNIEIVIVDGASTDDTLDVIRRYDERHPSLIKWLSEPDSGVYDALNKGIAIATGDVIATLHSGDRFVNTRVVDEAITHMLENDAPYVYGDVHYETATGQCVRLYSGSPDLEGALRRGMAPPHPSLFLRRELFDRVGVYNADYVVAADYDLFVRLVLVHGIIGSYLPLDMVAMALGGLSTQLKNRLFTNNIEKMRSLRENGISRYGLGVFRRYLFTSIQ